MMIGISSAMNFTFFIRYVNFDENNFLNILPLKITNKLVYFSDFSIIGATSARICPRYYDGLALLVDEFMLMITNRYLGEDMHHSFFFFFFSCALHRNTTSFLA